MRSEHTKPTGAVAECPGATRRRSSGQKLCEDVGVAIPSLPVVAALVASTSLGLVAPTHVGSLPLATTVSPRVAATNTPVAVSGTGCTSVVDVVETAFLFPGQISTTGQTVTPIAGAWSAVFPMPSAPTYVTATCDGVQSAPVPSAGVTVSRCGADLICWGVIVDAERCDV